MRSKEEIELLKKGYWASCPGTGVPCGVCGEEMVFVDGIREAVCKNEVGLADCFCTVCHCDSGGGSERCASCGARRRKDGSYYEP
jgi:hypothetical protein